MLDSSLPYPTSLLGLAELIESLNGAQERPRYVRVKVLHFLLP
jgi:hypothetical protein